MTHHTDADQKSSLSRFEGGDAGNAADTLGAAAIAAAASSPAAIALAEAGRNDLVEMLKRLNHILPPGTSDDSSMTHPLRFSLTQGHCWGVRGTPSVPSRFGSKLPHLC